MNRLEDIEKRLNQRGHHGANVYDIGSTHSSTDIACLLELVKNYELALNEIKALRIKPPEPAEEMQLIADEALTQGRKIKGET